MTPPNPTPTPRRFLMEPSTWTMVLLLLFGGGLLGAILWWPSALARFSDQAYARGVITFVISISTIGIAFVLIYQAFFSAEVTDERFRRAREVFTGLMGVLGTIVGFYFGSATGTPERLAIAELRLEDSRITTFVAGGVPPYRYVLTVGADTVARRESSDGWIDEKLTSALKPGDTVKIDVTDSQNRHVFREAAVPGSAPAARADTAGRPRS